MESRFGSCVAPSEGPKLSHGDPLGFACCLMCRSWVKSQRVAWVCVLPQCRFWVKSLRVACVPMFPLVEVLGFCRLMSRRTYRGPCEGFGVLSLNIEEKS